MSEPSGGHACLHHIFVAELLAGCGRHCLKLPACRLLSRKLFFVLNIEDLRYVDYLQGRTMSEPSGGHSCLHHTFVAEMIAGCARHCLKLRACRLQSRKHFFVFGRCASKGFFRSSVCKNWWSWTGEDAVCTYWWLSMSALCFFVLDEVTAGWGRLCLNLLAFICLALSLTSRS